MKRPCKFHLYVTFYIDVEALEVPHECQDCKKRQLKAAAKKEKATSKKQKKAADKKKKGDGEEKDDDAEKSPKNPKKK